MYIHIHIYIYIYVKSHTCQYVSKGGLVMSAMRVDAGGRRVERAGCPLKHSMFKHVELYDLYYIIVII